MSRGANHKERKEERAMKLKSLIEPGDPEQIATGFQFTEGPVWRPEGYLIFSDILASRMYKWTPDGTVTVWREPSGNSNGLTLDREGRLIACEHGNRRVSRTEADGTVVTLADRYGDKRLNSPAAGSIASASTAHWSCWPTTSTGRMGWRSRPTSRCCTWTTRRAAMCEPSTCGLTARWRTHALSPTWTTRSLARPTA
jgi:sugar lactone lactonase YvrE